MRQAPGPDGLGKQPNTHRQPDEIRRQRPATSPSPSIQAAPGDQRPADALLRIILEGTAGATGDRFFHSLVRCLGLALEASYVEVGECPEEDKSSVHVLASWSSDGVESAQEFPLEDTPCEIVARGQVFYQPQGVQASFPFNQFLAMVGAESYLGTPLFDSAGNVLGHLAVMDKRPQPPEPLALSILQLFAARAGAELERLRMETALNNALRQEQAMRCQLIQAGKLAAIGRLVASVTHELNNPLQAIENALYLVGQERPALSRQGHENLALAQAETERMATLINRLRETYRPAVAGDFQPEDVNELIREVQQLLAPHLRHNRVELALALAPALPAAPAIRDQLKQVLINLSMNAIEAMPGGGRLAIRTGHQPAAGQVWLAISDTGPGIAGAHLAHIYEPFFTTKDAGTGLGLAIAYDIVHRHQGRIEVDSNPDQGTTFTIWIPTVQQ
ncbi:MAG: ATP-binding protein [Chloroflexi bacterium]|nr:ATP-binding protein [Chloroflexota bacterium]MCI0575447.1 ATP-binding protein [Chloroflexota bacterium]MCI0644453.1 ATP-binding protein [Chloroflexota bacterium]MCI0731169.1 ATP-binding protein [Chloroflexota bacterium]